MLQHMFSKLWATINMGTLLIHAEFLAQVSPHNIGEPLSKSRTVHYIPTLHHTTVVHAGVVAGAAVGAAADAVAAGAV
eukprot:CAMPEP_0204003336 /NCGR_PEP_ID=MMETSP0360-20130528/17570_1 /ASSEMBLY_ACC=CAM_ASM_000342 /TAXON_ID=268821 /ORGANISM="Scrippsiella Hangoei, Strain SHTV-5" /LENGTH=77 /DNA_ID=CAMNT_0050945061 /DNA_START=93 /DNA_END=327 /DNA_ORIENTATION=-